MNTKLERIFTHSEDIVAREIDGEFIIVPISAGTSDLEDELFSLNETGQAIYNLVDGTKTIAQVIEIMVSEYEAAPGEIEQDVVQLVDELVRRKIVVEQSNRG